jgi:uncharacterized membrane protein
MMTGPRMRSAGLRRWASAGPRRWSIALVLAASGWLVLGLTMLTAQPVVRAPLVFAFVFVCPGLAVVRLLPLRDQLERAVLAVALGLSLTALAAEGMAISHILRPAMVLVVLASLCTAAAAAEVVRG